MELKPYSTSDENLRLDPRINGYFTKPDVNAGLVSNYWQEYVPDKLAENEGINVINIDGAVGCLTDPKVILEVGVYIVNKTTPTKIEKLAPTNAFLYSMWETIRVQLGVNNVNIFNVEGCFGLLAYMNLMQALSPGAKDEIGDLICFHEDTIGFEDDVSGFNTAAANNKGAEKR